LRGKLNTTLKKQWQEWEIPSNADKTTPTSVAGDCEDAAPAMVEGALLPAEGMDVSIAAKAVFESF